MPGLWFERAKTHPRYHQLQVAIYNLLQLPDESSDDFAAAIAKSADEEASQQLQELTFEIRGLQQLRGNRTLTESEYNQQQRAMRKAREIARMQCVVPAFTFVKAVNALDDRGCSYWCLKAVASHRDNVDALDFHPMESCFISHFKAPWFMLYHNIRAIKMPQVDPFTLVESPEVEAFHRATDGRERENLWAASRLRALGAQFDPLDPRKPLDTCVCNFTLTANRMATPLSNPLPWVDNYIEHYNSCTLSNEADFLADWGWQSAFYSYVSQHVACDTFMTFENYSVAGDHQLLITRTEADMMNDYEYKTVEGQTYVWSSFRKGFDNGMVGKKTQKSLVFDFHVAPIGFR
ncbi:hypothetical protein BCR37DRAFT_389131 [Protomyces lactucae-debilis]|uniref:Uncharacterized protein n=1 Tax=Protomyces lactucae-debilis TaxID=2754530 RepID=A0A1Y2F1D1_PROLT|nr:uncharacterized protein BCR37DRAFT_389131 [Protomyces lactucae-debilis]ORY77304.1 hypothetical protein BCR37DRAFT_389131 [Protomyces lactucae-debilis]